MILAASLIAKTILTSLINMYGPAFAHVAAALVSPVVSFAAVAWAQRALDRSPETLDLAELPKVPSPTGACFWCCLSCCRSCARW